LSEWMTNLPMEVKRRPITNIAIPGSHDSFAFSSSLSTALPVANDASSTMVKAGKIPGVRTFIKRWAVTQNLTISKQLEAGIRYLDLRVSNPPSKHNPENLLRSAHSLYGAPLLEMIESVKEFLMKHPKEVVLIDMNHLYGFDDELDKIFFDMINDILGVLSISQLVPAPSNLRPISMYTLEKMQRYGQNVILIAPFRGESHPFTDVLWNTNHIRSPWPNSDKIPYIISFLNKLSEERRKDPNPNSLLVYQGVATVRGTDIALHPLSSLEKLLSRSMTKATCDWLSQRYSRDGINIVIADFVSSDYSKLVIDVNLR
ncbi:hypothetical protein PENTCL1PPCAC_16547, partial [Pristionchus entomophagus]